MLSCCSQTRATGVAPWFGRSTLQIKPAIESATRIVWGPIRQLPFEGAGFVGKIQNLMGLDRITFTPVAQVNAVKTGSVICVHVGCAQVENIELNLGEAQSQLIERM
jgi:hypothetical protein